MVLKAKEEKVCLLIGQFSIQENVLFARCDAKYTDEERLIIRTAEMAAAGKKCIKNILKNSCHTFLTTYNGVYIGQCLQNYRYLWSKINECKYFQLEVVVPLVV